MRESVWGYAIITLGVLAIGIIWFFANVTRTDQHNYNLLKETVESAMLDSVDLSAYREDGTVKIVEEKFVENFIRRFSENADLSNTYLIEIFDVNETPPKVSLRVSSIKSTTYSAGKSEIVTFDIVNNIDAILEESYEESKNGKVDDSSTEQNKTSCVVTKKNCTSDNPCSYTQDYISNNGFPNTTCRDKTINWSIYIEDLKVPQQIKNEALNLGKTIDDIVFSPKSVSWVNAPLTQADLNNYASNKCSWYTGYRDSNGVKKEFKSSDCNKAADSVDRLAKLESASFKLSGNILNVEVISKCTDKIRSFEAAGNKGYSVSSKYRITFEYYFK